MGARFAGVGALVALLVSIIAVVVTVLVAHPRGQYPRELRRSTCTFGSPYRSSRLNVFAVAAS